MHSVSGFRDSCIRRMVASAIAVIGVLKIASAALSKSQLRSHRLIHARSAARTLRSSLRWFFLLQAVHLASSSSGGAFIVNSSSEI